MNKIPGLFNIEDLLRLSPGDRLKAMEQLRLNLGSDKAFQLYISSFDYKMRRDQRPPSEHFKWCDSIYEVSEPASPMRNLVYTPGRGWGKTKVLTALVYEARRMGVSEILLSGISSTDIYNTLINGPSGLKHAVPEFDGYSRNGNQRVTIFPANPRWGMDWETRVIERSHDDPEQFRGPSYELAAVDELSKGRKSVQAEAIEQIDYALRQPSRVKGFQGYAIYTMTPRTTPAIVNLYKDSDTFLIEGSTFDNPFLDSASVRRYRKAYDGTRKGQQELYGKLLEDEDGAVFSEILLNETRAKWVYSEGSSDYFLARYDRELAKSDTRRLGNENFVVSAPMRSRIVSVDCAGGRGRDKVGCAVVYHDMEGHTYIVEAVEIGGSAHQWLQKVADLYHKHSCTAVLHERNYGGDAFNEGYASRGVRNLVTFHTSEDKESRAETARIKFAEGTVHMAAGPSTLNPSNEDQLNSRVSLEKAEIEMTTWRGDMKSPNIMDAVCHGIRFYQYAGSAALEEYEVATLKG